MKIFFLAFAVLLVIGIFWQGIPLWQNLQGIRPALFPPPEDIAELIEDAAQEYSDPEDSVDFPLTLPKGFSISIFARDLGPARVMAWDENGVLLVSITKEGKVIALPDRDKDGKADETVTVIENLNRPHGLVFQGEKLYIAESDQVAVYEYDDESFQTKNKKKVIDLPNGGQHFSRTILFDDSDRLLTSVGSTCNACVESDWRRAAVLVSNADGSNVKAFASGLRNAVFMAIHPTTREVWVTEMGRDLLGDDLPPDEINILREDDNFGWPTCYGDNIHDTQYDRNTYIRNPCEEPFELPSYIDLQAHSAPLGLAFVPPSAGGWPEQFRDDLLVAYHGSWNRTVPTGYKIMRFELDETGTYLGREDFISGWLKDGGALGRPVDILIEPRGIMYISDDKAGVIYRVTYKGV